MFTILDYSSALEYSIIRRYTNIVYFYYKGGIKKEFNNYIPVAIINVMCKLFMMVVRERINEWVEESGMLGDIQCGFRRGRRTGIICLC